MTSLWPRPAWTAFISKWDVELLSTSFPVASLSGRATTTCFLLMLYHHSLNFDLHPQQNHHSSVGKTLDSKSGGPRFNPGWGTLWWRHLWCAFCGSKALLLHALIQFGLDPNWTPVDRSQTVASLPTVLRPSLEGCINASQYLFHLAWH